MNVTFRKTTNLDAAADITFNNMKPYYQKFAPDWDKYKVLEATEGLDNFDIVHNEQVVGVMRLQTLDDECFLRDLQVVAAYQNKGLGELALNEAKRLTVVSAHNILKLRVLKVSPAIRLYEKNGFMVYSEDERFFNMRVDIPLTA